MLIYRTNQVAIGSRPYCNLLSVPTGRSSILHNARPEGWTIFEQLRYVHERYGRGRGRGDREVIFYE